MNNSLKKKLIELKLWLISKFNFLLRLVHVPKLPINENGQVFLNLGCGPKSGKEFINVDTLWLPNIHLIQDIQDLSKFQTDSVDLVYGSHVVEHLPRKNLYKVLKEWRRVLKPGGIFRMSVPDFDKLIDIYMKNNSNVESVMSQVLGADGEYDDHHTIWNFNFAKKVLLDIGYKEVRIWDPATVEHKDFKDRSTRALDCPDGTRVPISLNIEAVK